MGEFQALGTILSNFYSLNNMGNVTSPLKQAGDTNKLSNLFANNDNKTVKKIHLYTD